MRSGNGICKFEESKFLVRFAKAFMVTIL
jgi:hypothetical protein